MGAMYTFSSLLIIQIKQKQEEKKKHSASSVTFILATQISLIKVILTTKFSSNMVVFRHKNEACIKIKYFNMLDVDSDKT